MRLPGQGFSDQTGNHCTHRDISPCQYASIRFLSRYGVRNKIHRYIAGKSEADFIADDLVQDAVIRNLETIGEAVTKLSAELKAEYKDVPWGDISGMRNRLIHGYISVNLQVVGDTVERLLPALLEQIKNIEEKTLKRGSIR